MKKTPLLRKTRFKARQTPLRASHTTGLRKTRLAPVGVRGRRLRDEDAETREKVLLRDGGCVLAKEWPGHVCIGGLVAHHILTKQARPDLRHYLPNLVTVCEIAGHQGFAHFDVAKAREFFLSRLSTEQLAVIQEGLK